MQLTAELAHTRSRYLDYYNGRYFYAENYVTLNLFLQEDITDHIDIVGHYIFGDVGIGIGFRGDHKYVGFKYTPFVNLNSILYRERYSKPYVSIGFSDDAYLRLGSRNFNAYINYPLLLPFFDYVDVLQPYLSLIATVETGVRISRYSVGYTYRTGDLYYAYYFGQIEFENRKLTKIRIGYNSDTDRTCYAISATYKFGKISGD